MFKFTQAPFEDDLNVDNWPRWATDHCDVDKVKAQGNEIVNKIIDNAPLEGNHDLVVVDVRTQLLLIGQATLTLGWHGDMTEDPTAIQHIYMIGEHRTEFLEDGIVKVPHNHYASYTTSDIHRAVEVFKDEFRLFVRVQECNDFYRPHLKADLMSYYPEVFTLPGGDPFYIDEAQYLSYFDKYSHLNTGKH